MTTHTKMRAGTAWGCAFKDCTRPAGPCAGNCQLHRVVPEQVERDEEATAQASTLPTATQFAGEEPDADAPTISEFSADVLAATWSFWAWSALIWTVIWFFLGYLVGRDFS